MAYYLRRLNSAEYNYPIHDKEMLAIISCLREWEAELQLVAKSFSILSGHKNLSYFSVKRLLNERQLRYNDLLYKFNFVFKWRPGSSCERPYALSRRDQDKPKGLSDERNAGRVIKVLASAPTYLANLAKNSNETKTPESQTTVARIFDCDEMQSL